MINLQKPLRTDTIRVIFHKLWFDTKIAENYCSLTVDYTYQNLLHKFISFVGDFALNHNFPFEDLRAKFYIYFSLWEREAVLELINQTPLSDEEKTIISNFLIK